MSNNAVECLNGGGANADYNCRGGFVYTANEACQCSLPTPDKIGPVQLNVTLTGSTFAGRPLAAMIGSNAEVYETTQPPGAQPVYGITPGLNDHTDIRVYQVSYRNSNQNPGDYTMPNGYTSSFTFTGP